MAKYIVRVTIEVPDEDDVLGHVESWVEEAIIEALEVDGMPTDDAVEVERI